ncbi:MAG TPA: DEAD/DEAH box helicase [Solirubrobacteraceae bacterium]|nr:DEAD/DEAH box helicase [Solirubrobacteraceae bacterium]
MLTLRPYQTAAVTAAEEAEGRVLIVLPTGAGKTVCFAHLIARRGGDALVLAHRDELLEQAANKIVMVAPELADAIGMVKGKRNDVAANVVVGSVQTLARARRLTQMRRVFRTVIVDEAHHATAASYQRILEYVGESAKILGFTATAERSDGSDLRGTFDTLGYARSLKEMIAEGYLCDLRALRINLDGLDLRRVRKSGGDYRAADLGRAMQNAGVVRHVVTSYQQYAAGKKTIAFFPTVATSQAAAAAFRDAGFRTAHLDGNTPIVERRGILGAFACGHLDIITNVGVLLEGYDEPSIECIILAAPTRSRIKFTQAVGRGTRLYAGKRYCLVLDMAGVSDDLSLQSTEMLFDLSEPIRPGESAMQAVAHERRAAGESGGGDEDYVDGTGAATVEERDLFDRDAIQWVWVGDRPVLALNDESVVMDPIGSGLWRVLLLNDHRARPIAKNLDYGYAQGCVEDLVRRYGVVELADKNARWRHARASPAQVARLRNLGVDADRNLTRGQATDLITEATAAERLARFDVAERARVA